MKTKEKNELKIKINKPLNIGSILEGEVISKKGKEIYLDLSPYGTGRVYGIFYLQSKNLAQKVKPGDRAGAKIVGLNDGYGNYEVVLQEMLQLDRWQKILEYYKENKILELEIKEANRGGWIVEVEGINGFIPVSNLSPEYYPRIDSNNKNLILEHLKKFVKKKIKCRIISVNPESNKLILSEKAAKEELYREILNQYIVGEILNVKIVGLSQFGLFVRFHENPPIDGLIHISEIPEESSNLEKKFKVGDVLKAKLIQLKQDKVSFSLKDLSEDKWVVFVKNHKVGDKIEGMVEEKNDIFAIVKIDNTQGLVFEDSEKLKVKEKYLFTIDKINSKEKSLILKLSNE